MTNEQQGHIAFERHIWQYAAIARALGEVAGHMMRAEAMDVGGGMREEATLGDAAAGGGFLEEFAGLDEATAAADGVSVLVVAAELSLRGGGSAREESRFFREVSVL